MARKTPPVSQAVRHVLPGSLVGRAVLAMVAGLTMFHATTTVIYTVDRQQRRVVTSEVLLGERAGVLARVFESVPPAARPALAEAMAGNALQARWQPGPEPLPPAGTLSATRTEDDEIKPIGEALERVRPAAVYRMGGFQPVRRARGWTDFGFLRWLWVGLPDERRLPVAISLNDGSWLDLNLRLPPPLPLWSPGFLVSTGFMAIAVVLFALGAARWIMAPLATFTQAAEKLARDVRAPPLAVDGLAEVRGAAQAFNAMQQSIRRILDDRTQMMAAIAHDLRTPITRLRLRGEMLPSGAVQKRILRDLDEMEAMVEASLQFVRQDFVEERSEPIDLAALLATVCDETGETIGDAVFSWSGSVTYVCRPLAIKRAFSNLIGNAVKYGLRATVSLECGGAGVTVLIEDEGPGIPAEETEAVFAPFYRIETSRCRSTGGIGLGLSVARGIVRAHGGEILLANRAEGGLRVAVTLPRPVGDRAA